MVDGLKGFPEAIAAVFPKTQVQACIVHLIRSSLDYVSYKDRKAVAAALKEVYRARTAEAGQAALEAFDEGPWGRKYPVIAQSWRRHWAEVIPFYAFPADVRRIIYTTNAIEALNAKLRRAVRARGHFPTDDAVLKLLFLVLNLAAKEWRMPAREWTAAKAQFAILFEDRFATLFECFFGCVPYCAWRTRPRAERESTQVVAIQECARPTKIRAPRFVDDVEAAIAAEPSGRGASTTQPGPVR